MLLLWVGDKQSAKMPRGWLPSHGGDMGRVLLRAEPGFAVLLLPLCSFGPYLAQNWPSGR